MNTIKKRIAILAFLTCGLLTACNDAYVEKYILLDDTNSYLAYTDTTVVVKWVKSTVINVAKPDSFYILPNYPYVLALDTIIGTDTLGNDIPNIYKKTVVNTLTGAITLNNGTRLFKIGTYKIYVGLLTENGFIKYRDKPVKMSIVP